MQGPGKVLGPGETKGIKKTKTKNCSPCPYTVCKLVEEGDINNHTSKNKLPKIKRIHYQR